MPEWNYNLCNLQVTLNSNYKYKLSFSLEMILDFDKQIPAVIFKYCPAYQLLSVVSRPNAGSKQNKINIKPYFCNLGTYLLSCLSRVVLIESSKFP